MIERWNSCKDFVNSLRFVLRGTHNREVARGDFFQIGNESVLLTFSTPILTNISDRQGTVITRVPR